MTILVVSDVHGRGSRLRDMLDAQISRPEMILFLGDGYSDVSRQETDGIPVVSVRGNCDVWSLVGMEDIPDRRMLDLDGRKILMMHGHSHGVGYGVDRAVGYAASLGADILLYGHTHVKFYHRYEAGETVGGVRLERELHVFNPGSLGQPRDGGDPSFGVIEMRRECLLFSWGKI